jgi:hypothetical protein
MDLYLCSPYTPSWRDRDNLTLTFPFFLNQKLALSKRPQDFVLNMMILVHGTVCPANAMKAYGGGEGITPLILNFGHWMDVNNQLEAQKPLNFQPFRCEELSSRQNWWSGHTDKFILKTGGLVQQNTMICSNDVISAVRLGAIFVTLDTWLLLCDRWWPLRRCVKRVSALPRLYTCNWRLPSRQPAEQ